MLLNCGYYHRLEVVDEALADTWAQLLVSMCPIAVGKFDLGTWLVSIVRWEPHLVRFLPVGTFDVNSLYTDRLVPLIWVLSTQNQVTNAAFNILAIVQPCCSALLHGRDGVEALLQEFAELLLSHLEHHVVKRALFEVPFDDGPQALDTVELWAVGRHEEQFDLQVLRPLLVEQCPMCGSIVNHNVKFGAAYEESRAQGVQESSESLSVG